MQIKINKFFYKMGAPIIYFIATTFLASIWADSGFKIWKNLNLLWAIVMWLLYLVPVFLGYYLGMLLDTLDREIMSLLRGRLGLQPTAAIVRSSKEELLTGLVTNDPKYKRLWLLGIIFYILVIADIILTILLYKSNLL